MQRIAAPTSNIQRFKTYKYIAIIRSIYTLHMCQKVDRKDFETPSLVKSYPQPTHPLRINNPPRNKRNNQRKSGRKVAVLRNNKELSSRSQQNTYTTSVHNKPHRHWRIESKHVPLFTGYNVPIETRYFDTWE